MNKTELRRQRLECSNAGGDLQTELEEMKKVQRKGAEEIETITLTCSEFLTLICC